MKKSSFDVDNAIAMFLNGETELYGDSIVKHCVPDASYIEVLGRGLEGCVIKIKHNIMNREEALKIHCLNTSIDSRDRFLRSGNIFNLLEYSANKDKQDYFFPRVYDVCSRPAFIRMEVVRGKKLTDYILQNQDMHEDDKLSIFVQICVGVKQMHGHGVIHRDLKPDNIIINELGVPKIIDFGFSKSDMDLDITADGRTMGTPKYSSPEQLSDAGNADARSDIFSLCKIMYFMLAGNEEFNPIHLPKKLIMLYTQNTQYNRDKRTKTTKEFLEMFFKIYPDLRISNQPMIENFIAKAFLEFNALNNFNTGKVKNILKLDIDKWKKLTDITKEAIILNEC